MAERRIKKLFFNQNVLVDIFNWMAAPEGKCIALPDVPEIPPDTEVLWVGIEPEMGCLYAIVHHPSWPALDMGMLPEALPDIYSVRKKTGKSTRKEADFSDE